MPIRLKIFSGCLALAMLTIILAMFAQRSERHLGALALDLYDDTFMSMSYLRSAQVDFADVERAMHEGRSIETPARDLLEDLAVAAERSSAGRQRLTIARLRAHLDSPTTASFRAETPPSWWRPSGHGSGQCWRSRSSSPS